MIFIFNVVKLKDPFPPARIAGINAFAATQQYYSLTDTSIRVLPMICSLMVDPEKPVRDQAFKVRKSLNFWNCRKKMIMNGMY